MKNKIMALFVAAMLCMPATIFASVSDDQVTSIKIKEADGTTGQNTNTGSGVKTGHIQDGAVTDAKISGVIAGAKLGSHGHSGADLTDGTVTTSKLADGVVTEAKIGGLISAAKIDATGFAADTVDGFHAADLATVQHGHEQADVSGLDAALASKSDVTHTHLDAVSPSYANVVVVAKTGGDFTSLGQALSAITPTADSPYMVKIMPGVYVEGRFQLKGFVSIEGSGVNNTIIKSDGSYGALMSFSGSIDCEISNVSFVISDLASSHTPMFIDNVTSADMLDPTVFSRLRIHDVVMNIRGPNIHTAYAMNLLKVDLTLVDSSIDINLPEGTGGMGIVSYSGNLLIAGSSISTSLTNSSSNDIFNAGLMLLGGNAKLVSSEVTASNTETQNLYAAAILAGGCSGSCGTTPDVKIISSTVKGPRALMTASTNGVGGRIFVAGSQVDGSVNDTSVARGTVKMVNCFDAGFLPIANQ